MTVVEQIPPETRSQRLLRWADDRLSPILVKEVRQAMRGRQFVVAFSATLLLAAMIGIGIMINTTSRVEIGDAFLLPMFGCLCAAVLRHGAVHGVPLHGDRVGGEHSRSAGALHLKPQM